MQGRLYANLGVVMALLLAVVIVAFSEKVVAQTTCPSGTVVITAATRADATAAGLPTSVQCWNPNDPSVGQAAGEAKMWLAQHATKGSNISCLNASFAEKLEKFMQAVPGGPPIITSGYRSPDQQNTIIASGSGATRVTTACGSYHVWGLAADFNNDTASQTAWMRANARTYGIATIGAWDPNHFQDASGKYGQCGVCSSNGMGTLTAPTGPVSPDDVPPQSVVSQFSVPPGYCLTSSQPITVVPCSNLSNPTAASPFQTAPIAQPQTIPAQPSPSVTPTPSSSSACSPQYYCSNNTVYYQSNTCSTSVFQACKNGCLGTTCALATSTSASPTDILQQLITLNPATTSTTSASLNSGIYNILQGIFSPQSQAPSQTQVVQNPTYPLDTFTASDLSGNFSGTQSGTYLQQLLSSLKSALLGFLSFFQGRAQ
jgi:hypothetical protein